MNTTNKYNQFICHSALNAESRFIIVCALLDSRLRGNDKRNYF
jgi:hypothetical protein